MKTESTTAAADLASIISSAGTSSKRSWMRIIVLFIVIGVGAFVWFRWNQRVQAQNQPVPYITETLKRDSIHLTITATGNLEPTNEVTIGSELSGTTLEVYVDTNDHVTKGQPLAKLDTSKLTQQTESSRASLNSAKARVEQAEATLKESEASLARVKNLEQLSSGKAVSKADLDTATATADRARADLLSAKAAVGEAEAQVRINESDLEKAVIKSPIDGIVLTRAIEPGQTVAASFTAPELFVLAEKLEHMKLKVAVAEADIGRVKADQTAVFTVDAWPDRRYNATVTKVAFGSAVTDNVVTYETELVVSNDDLSLRPGMTATADINVADAENVFVVSNAALRFDPSSSGPGAGSNAALRFDPSSSGPGAGPGGMGPGQNKTFVQTLMPGPPRRSGGGGRNNNDEAQTPKSKAGNYRVWVLKDGKPEAIPVRLGISDSRVTEVTGEGLSEGLPIILRANSVMP